MVQLFIIRHAQAEQDHSQSDFERKLTAKGRHDASNLGRYLQAEKLIPQKILFSSAKRTSETFLQINQSIENSAYEQRKDIYNASFEDLRALIAATHDAVKSLMIIGHNPGMHALALYFSKAGEQPREFPPASLLILDFDAAWSKFRGHSGKKIAFRRP
jgi:phosphohistidine phosphatase